MLAGEAAATFAARPGLDTAPEAWFRTAERQPPTGGDDAAAAPSARSPATPRGGVAAATSTGGTSGKHPGRVGDSPILAAGTWADDATAAISCTGDGEAIIRVALAHEIDALMRHAGCRSPRRATGARAPGRVSAPRADRGRRRRLDRDPVHDCPRCRAPGESGPARRRGDRWLTVDQLYGLPLEEFTPARDAAAKEMRKAGDREAARASRSCRNRRRRPGRPTRSRASSPS